MNDDLWFLARYCYGYGSWNGSYWFIGPEQGGSEKKMTKRAEAFRKLDLDNDGLCDCREFHREIYEPGQPDDWFRLERLPPLQTTWYCLMLTLMSYKGKVGIEKPTKGHLLYEYQRTFREYQRDHWGSSAGKTCVIERSGIPAKNFKESSARRASLSQTERNQLDDILRSRVEHITERIRANEPEFVVIYSNSQYPSWEVLRKESSKITQSPNETFKLGRTLIAFTESTGKNSPGHARWLALGQDLRKHRSTTHGN
jgi:hypothetical protein